MRYPTSQSIRAFVGFQKVIGLSRCSCWWEQFHQRGWGSDIAQSETKLHTTSRCLCSKPAAYWETLGPLVVLDHLDNTPSGWHFGAQGPLGHCTSIDGQWLPLQSKMQNVSGHIVGIMGHLSRRRGMIPDFDEIWSLDLQALDQGMWTGLPAVLEVISHALPGGWESWRCHKTFEAPRVFWWNFTHMSREIPSTNRFPTFADTFESIIFPFPVWWDTVDGRNPKQPPGTYKTL